MPKRAMPSRSAAMSGCVGGGRVRAVGMAGGVEELLACPGQQQGGHSRGAGTDEERVLATSGAEHVGPRTGDVLFSVEEERNLPLQNDPCLILASVSVDRRRRSQGQQLLGERERAAGPPTHSRG